MPTDKFNVWTEGAVAFKMINQDIKEKGGD